LAQTYDVVEDQHDTRVSKLQLRAFGPVPGIQDSFFLVSMRTEKTPRLPFAMFQIPIGGSHTFNINSGGGGLSNALILSSAKQLLLDAPYHVYSACEQGNGAAAEVAGGINLHTGAGPLLPPGLLKYRFFVAGGSGRFAGNVGGRYFTYDNTNYTYSVGTQLGINAIGHYSRWDSPFLYVPVPTALSFSLGAKYDQRAQERYPAVNATTVFRFSHLVLMAENYTKRELEFESWQTAYNVQVGLLVWPKHLLIAADYGQFIPTEMENPPETLETDVKKNMQGVTQWRAALHWYFFRNIGLASLVYTDKTTSPYIEGDDPQLTREVKLVGQYRF